jgi:hypothetical protein
MLNEGCQFKAAKKKDLPYDMLRKLTMLKQFRNGSVRQGGGHCFKYKINFGLKEKKFKIVLFY